MPRVRIRRSAKGECLFSKQDTFSFIIVVKLYIPYGKKQVGKIDSNSLRKNRLEENNSSDNNYTSQTPKHTKRETGKIYNRIR